MTIVAEPDGEALYHEYLPAIEFALVYHDIALWTDNALAYLEPSVGKSKSPTTTACDDLAIIITLPLERAKKAGKGNFSKEQLQVGVCLLI
jgi:hypothetical protein